MGIDGFRVGVRGDLEENGSRGGVGGKEVRSGGQDVAKLEIAKKKSMGKGKKVMETRSTRLQKSFSISLKCVSLNYF